MHMGEDLESRLCMYMNTASFGLAAVSINMGKSKHLSAILE